MLSALNTEFSGWLQEELNKRDWSYADLARKSGLTRATISNIMSENRQPGPEAARAIAAALELPEEVVFREAGLLSPAEEPEQDPTFLELVWEFWHSDIEGRRRMVRMFRAFREAQEAEERARRQSEDTQTDAT